MLIGIIPKVKKNHTEYEFSLDFNLIKFLHFVFPGSKCEILYSKYTSKKVDMIVLSGGNELPLFSKKKENRIRFELNNFFFKRAMRNDTPVIGICYGAQFIANFFQSRLVKIDDHVALNHKIYPSNKKNKGFIVNSFHNYGIKKLGKNLFPIYYSKDETIECFKHNELKILGLMWHPERHAPFRLNDKRIIKKLL